MAATLYPSTLGYVWGITTTQTGMSMSDYRQSDTTDKFEQKDGQGEVIAVVSYNPRSEITMTGETFAAFAGSVVAGKEIFTANLILPESATAGLVFCQTVEYTASREAMQKATITATMYPLIPAGTPPGP